MTSVQQVEQAVRIAKEPGRPIATPEQAKAILKIGTWYKTPGRPSSILVCHRTAKEGSKASWFMKPTGRYVRRRRLWARNTG